MVYRGRPSTGCKTCRERKIKCDERPEGCAKCEKRGTKCPGYDNNVDALFHDETANVLAKAKKSKAKAVAAREAQVIPSREVALLPKEDRASPNIHILAPLVDQGVTFFMHNYTMGIDQPPITSKAYHQHLSTHGFHPLIATTMTALGIAGVANIYMDSALKREATRWYLNAIKMANAALSCKADVRNDTTLVAINLLSIFEATFNENSFSGWSNHVDGASSLVKLRGKSQFATQAGRRLYLHTIGLYTINCMGKGEPMPGYVRELNEEVVKYMDSNDPRTGFFFLQQETNDLRARILTETAIDLRYVIDKALELESMAISIFEKLEGDWTYENVPSFGQVPGVYGDYYHVYPTHTIAQTWNYVRYNRIYIHDIVRNAIIAGLSTSPPVLDSAEYMGILNNSTCMLLQLQSDIIASIPQFLHDTPKAVPRKPSKAPTSTSSETSTPERESSVFSLALSMVSMSSPETTPSPSAYTPAPTQKGARRKGVKPDVKSLNENFRTGHEPDALGINKKDENNERVPIVRISGGYSTLWSLYVAGSMPTASAASQVFVLHCLDRVGREFGINQAKVFANALRLKRKMIANGTLGFKLCPQYLPPDPDSNIPFAQPDHEAFEHVVEQKAEPTVEQIPQMKQTFVSSYNFNEIPAPVYSNIQDASLDDFAQIGAEITLDDLDGYI